MALLQQQQRLRAAGAGGEVYVHLREGEVAAEQREG